MKLYLAHNFAARDSLVHVIKILEAIGHEITSNWITDDSHLDIKKETESAIADLADIDRADGILLFIDQYGPKPGKGKFIELGYALGKGKQCYIIGDDKSSVFYFHPEVHHIKNFTEIPL